MFGYIMGIIFILWSLYTLFALGTTNDMTDFMRSTNFIILCVGYIVILAVYFMFKDMFRRQIY